MLSTSKYFIALMIVLSQIYNTSSFKIYNNIIMQKPSIILDFLDKSIYNFNYQNEQKYRNFILYSEKRHKEAMFGRKFDKKPKSSQVRHYRIVGRGGGVPRLCKRTKLPAKPIILPARRCALLGKMDNTKAIKRSHSGIRTKRTQKVNLQWKKIWHPNKRYFIKLRLSMKGLKTIKRLGLIEAARRFHLDIDNRKLFAGFANLKEKDPSKEITPEEFFNRVNITNTV